MLLGIVTVASSVVVFGVLALLLVAKPQQQQQDIRQEAFQTDPCATITAIPSTECRALYQLYQSTGGPNWRVARDEIAWFSNSEPCTWYGIKCSDSGITDNYEQRRIVDIALADRNLVGQLPRVFLSLPILQALNVSDNQLTGSLQDTDVLLHLNLTSLNVANNQLGGSILHQFYSNQKFYELKLNNNSFTGTLPESLGLVQSLRILDVRNSRLSGAIPLAYSNLPLTTLLSAGSDVCLPSGLATWYGRVVTTDGMPSCDAPVGATATPTASPSPSRTPTPTIIGSATATPTPTRTPTPVTGAQCNQGCSSNNDCATNLRCVNIDGGNRCRLASNPTDQYCGNPPDQGLNFSCNQYCSDASECADGLACWFNRCRHPENVTSLSCVPPAAELRTLMDQNCNTRCSSNRDCAVNLRCYQGYCRLATYPQSTNCRALPAPTRPAGSAGTTAPPKGATTAPLPTSSISPSATSSATLSRTPTPTRVATTPDETDTQPSEAPTPTTSVTADLSPAPSTPPPSDETASDTVLGIILGWIQQAPSTILQSRILLYILAGAGLVLLILGFLTGRKSKNQANRFAQPTPVSKSGVPAAQTTQPSQTMMAKLQQKGVTPKEQASPGQPPTT